MDTSTYPFSYIGRLENSQIDATVTKLRIHHLARHFINTLACFNNTQAEGVGLGAAKAVEDKWGSRQLLMLRTHNDCRSKVQWLLNMSKSP